MKIFFIVAVLIAVVYLAMPQNSLVQLKQYLPQEKIDQAASSLMSKVDEKLNTVKQQLLAKQEERISLLEDKVAKLQQQLANKRATSDFAQSNLQSENNLLNESKPKEKKPNEIKSNISRQVQLQQIAEKMNKSSLLAIIDH
ncbi:MAG: hypothetical protein OCD00_12845 [Colwellia sp.]